MIANNVANSATLGFQKGWIGLRLVPGSVGPAVDLTTIGPASGELEVTRRPLDLAIRGAGYFSVRDLETGAELFTRAGNFNIDGSGRLVTADGRCQVMGADGHGIVLSGVPGDVRVDPDGRLSQGEVENGQLGVVEFEDVSRLRRRGDNLFENLGSALGIAPGSRVEQGALERSSVHPVLETAEMIRALRALEANLQMIRIQEATLERTVNELARPEK